MINTDNYELYVRTVMVTTSWMNIELKLLSEMEMKNYDYFIYELFE